jgi:hypothetical protein
MTISTTRTLIILLLTFFACHQGFGQSVRLTVDADNLYVNRRRELAETYFYDHTRRDYRLFIGAQKLNVNTGLLSAKLVYAHIMRNTKEDVFVDTFKVSGRITNRRYSSHEIGLYLAKGLEATRGKFTAQLEIYGIGSIKLPSNYYTSVYGFTGAGVAIDSSLTKDMFRKVFNGEFGLKASLYYTIARNFMVGIGFSGQQLISIGQEQRKTIYTSYINPNTNYTSVPFVDRNVYSTTNATTVVSVMYLLPNRKK